MTDVKLKRCSRCHLEKPLSDFYHRSRGGVVSGCKPCLSQAAKDRNAKLREENPGRFTAASTAWRKANPLKDRLRHVKLTYGLEGHEYLSLLETQDNACAICFRTFVKTPHVDHNHTTKKVRGLLCASCNTILGLSGDSIEILNRAIKYLEHDDNK